MKKIEGFSKGMGVGGWLTNYKRFNVLPQDRRLVITKGDMEHFETYINESDIVNIKNMGMDHIRVGFDQIVVEESPYKYRNSILKLIREFGDNCKKHGLTLVLNLHKAIGNYCDIEEEVTLLESDDLQKRFITVWVEMEKLFADDNSVMFELLNEVRNVEPELWNKLAERTVDALREMNSERRIIIGSTCWNDADKLKDLKVFDDENIFYTFHTYKPFEFTHQQGVLQAQTLYYNRKMEYPSDDIERYNEYFKTTQGIENYYGDIKRMDIGYIRKSLEGAKKFTEENPDKVLWCGEFGTIRHCAIACRENWMADVIRVLGEYDIPYCVWNYLSTPNDGNRFSLVDDDTRKILSERMADIIAGKV